MKADDLAKEIIEFIQWLTPCGEVNPGPSLETIGREARKLNKKILEYQRRQGVLK